jgi:radical SAM superfamily enzyme YgiQ (UPF0313 family)
MKALQILLVSTYDLGHQPFALASPAAWLAEAGHHVTCADLAVAPLPSAAVKAADLVCFHLPMHTATRLALAAIPKVRAFHPTVPLCAYGLYAPLNRQVLQEAGVRYLIGGEFEAELVRLAERLACGGEQPSGIDKASTLVPLERLQFRVPNRSGLPNLNRYAKLHLHRNGHAETRRVGYTEASRGCKHTCRHCPIVPVYEGRFRIVSPDVVMEDIRRQVTAGAQHISFGDPDFFNGPAHAMRIVEALHHEFLALTYDVVIKIEHLLDHRDLLTRLRGTGCAFVTSAVESTEDVVLEHLDKGHTRADFLAAAEECRRAGLTLCPTFVPFTPWTTLEGYRDLLKVIVDLDLVENVAPIQLALRLLLPAGSKLLALPYVQQRTGSFDPKALIYRWTHKDERIDRLSAQMLRLVTNLTRQRISRSAAFSEIWRTAHDAANGAVSKLPEDYHLRPRATIPYMDEPWYC